MPMSKEERKLKIEEAIAAYKAGEAISCIEAKTGLPNQTIYRHLDAREIKRQRRPKGFLLLCVWCGKPLPPRKKKDHYKTCGDAECRAACGYPPKWKPNERRELARLTVSGFDAKVIAKRFPGRTIVAIQHQMRKARRSQCA